MPKYKPDFFYPDAVRFMARHYEIYSQRAVDSQYREEVAEAHLMATGESDLAAKIVLGGRKGIFNDRERALSQEMYSRYSRKKKERFEEEGDSYFGMTHERYSGMLLENGFERQLSYRINNGLKETEIWFKKKDALLILLERVGGNIFSSTIHYELRTKRTTEELEPIDRIFLESIAKEKERHFVKWTDAGGGFYCIKKSVIEGLISHLGKIGQNGWPTKDHWWNFSVHFPEMPDERKAILGNLPFTTLETIGMMSTP